MKTPDAQVLEAEISAFPLYEVIWVIKQNSI